ncbi:hypothetical protein JL722_14799 [Aureococcus anophagefferens]|nr:hypothetical protein JL722_14799 [Aureococcus anophagefferens]
MATLQRKHETELQSATATLEVDKDRERLEAVRERDAAHAKELQDLEASFVERTRSELEARDAAHTKALAELQMQHENKVTSMQDGHAASLASATEMLALEKDHDHSSALVSALRARDDEHATAMEAREKEFAEKHAAALSDLQERHKSDLSYLKENHEGNSPPPSSRRRRRRIATCGLLTAQSQEHDTALARAIAEREAELKALHETELDARADVHARAVEAADDAHARAVEDVLLAAQKQAARDEASLQETHRAELAAEQERHQEMLSQAAHEYDAAVKATLSEKDEEHAKLLADASRASPPAASQLREADESRRLMALRAASTMADSVLTRGSKHGVLRSFRVWALYSRLSGAAASKDVDHDVALRSAVTQTRAGVDAGGRHERHGQGREPPLPLPTASRLGPVAHASPSRKTPLVRRDEARGGDGQAGAGKDQEHSDSLKAQSEEHSAAFKAQTDAFEAELESREAEILAKHKAALKEQADRQAAEIDEALAAHRQQQDMLRSKHETELASATEMLALEKDHDHSSALVRCGPDDEHAKAMDSREKELAERHAAALAEQKASLSSAHESAHEETVARHEDAVATLRRKHEADLESATGALGVDKDRERLEAVRERETAHAKDLRT